MTIEDIEDKFKTLSLKRKEPIINLLIEVSKLNKKAYNYSLQRGNYKYYNILTLSSVLKSDIKKYKDKNESKS